MKHHVKAFSVTQLALITTTLRAKGLEPPTTELSDINEDPEYFDNGDCVRGLWNILLYIEDRFPAPALLGGTPLRRSYIRSLSNDLIKIIDRPLSLIGALDEYVPHLKPNQFVLHPHNPCLLDVVLAVVAPQAPVWAKIQTLLTAPIDTDEEEDDDPDENPTLLSLCG